MNMLNHMPAHQSPAYWQSYASARLVAVYPMLASLPAGTHNLDNIHLMTQSAAFDNSSVPKNLGHGVTPRQP